MKNQNNILKFRALRFNSSGGDISSLVAPPYDVFNYGDSTDRRLRSNPSNIVHIQKPLGEGGNKYKNAGGIFRRFISESVLIREKSPAFYILREDGQHHTRTGLMAAVKIDRRYERIRDHERTKPKPLKDRIELTLATNTNIGPVFSVASDSGGDFRRALEKDYRDENLLYDFTSTCGVRNRLYKSASETFSDILNPATLYIADGHHRYKTSIEYSRMMRKKPGRKDGNFNYVLTYIVPRSALTIYPTHRLISNISPEKAAAIADKLESSFQASRHKDISPPRRGEVGIYFGGEFFTVESTMAGKPDTVFLEEKILKPFFTEDLKINHLSGPDEILPEVKKKVDDGKFRMAFVMAPLSFKDVQKAADRKEMLPPKSTYFYPKVPSGMVMHELIQARGR